MGLTEPSIVREKNSCLEKDFLCFGQVFMSSFIAGCDYIYHCIRRGDLA